MKLQNKVELEIRQLGIKNRFWGRPEIRELQHILSEDEVITNAVNGHYEGGFALLLSTDQRLLLVDKKLWFLSMEDIRYDMISEVDYCARLLDSTISVVTLNKILRFTAIRKKNLRSLTTYIQDKITVLRSSREPMQAPSQQLTTQQPNLSIQPIQAPNQPIVASPALILPEEQPLIQTEAPRSIPIPMRPFRRIGAYPVTALRSQRTTLNRPRFSY